MNSRMPVLALALGSHFAACIGGPTRTAAMTNGTAQTDLPAQPAAEATEPGLPGVATPGCHQAFLNHFDYAAASGGPLRLELISCAAFGGVSANFGVPSPDGAKLLRWSRERDHVIEVVQATGGTLLDFPNRITFASFGTEDYGALPDGVAWTRGSDGFWTVRQDVMNPSGFSLGPMRPIRVGLDGTVRALPDLPGPERLDAIKWVGSDGLALAQFWTRGNYYRPEQEDLEPTLAIIDAARGLVRDRIRIKAIPALRRRAEAGFFRVVGATATVLADGRVRAVVEISAWGERPAGTSPGANFEPILHPALLLIWTEGEPALLRSLDRPSRPATRMVLSPDGARLLLLHTLEPESIVGCGRVPCRRPMPLPVPVEGVFAELIDTTTGRSRWRLGGRVTSAWGQRARPAISPDGRHALLQLPGEQGRRYIALVRMRDGRVLNRFSVTQVGSYPESIGFSPDGGRVWVTVVGSLYRYRLAL